MAFGRVWQHAKYSYWVCESVQLPTRQAPFREFAFGPQIEKCKHLCQLFGFGTRGGPWGEGVGQGICSKTVNTYYDFQTVLKRPGARLSKTKIISCFNNTMIS